MLTFLSPELTKKLIFLSLLAHFKVNHQRSDSAMEADCSAASPKDSMTRKQTDDPRRFSAIYRMFEAKTALPKIEKGTTAGRQPPPSNRLKPKKANVSTMTESVKDDDDDDNDYDIQADDTCGSSTFDQQTETDTEMGKGDVGRSTNHKKPNRVTESAATEDDDFESSYLEGDEGTTSQRERATGGKVTPERVTLPSHGVHCVAGKSQNCPELEVSSPVNMQAQHRKAGSVCSEQPGKSASDVVSQSKGMQKNDEECQAYENVAWLTPSGLTPKTNKWKSESNFPTSLRLEFQAEADRGISGADDLTGRPSNRGEIAQPDYANVALTNLLGSSIMNPEQDDDMSLRVTRPTMEGSPNSVNLESPESGSVDRKHATHMSRGSAGVVTRPHANVDPGKSGGKCTGKPVTFDSWKSSCDQMADLNTIHARSPNPLLSKNHLQENDAEFNSSRPEMLSSHTGKPISSSLSKVTGESDFYGNVTPSKQQNVSSEEKSYKVASTEIGNRSITQHTADKSNGDCNKYSPDEDEHADEYDNVTLPGTEQQQQQQQQQQQKLLSAAGQHPSESGTRKQASSSTVTGNVQPLERDSNTWTSLESTEKDLRVIGQNRELNSGTNRAIGTQMAPQSFNKSMSTNTEDTKYPSAKIYAELECQTESFNDISQSTDNVQKLSTDPQNEDSLGSYSWYFGNVDRELADAILEDMINVSGSFLIRRSYRGGEGNPYTVSVVCSKRIYHVLIRQRPDGGFSIGKEKEEDKVFSSVPDLITFYRNNYVELIGDVAKQMPPGKVQLKICPPK